MNPDEQVVARALEEGAVLQGIDGEGDIDTEEVGDDGDQNVPNAAAMPQPVPSTSTAHEEPVSITINWDSEKIKELLEAVPQLHDFDLYQDLKF